MRELFVWYRVDPRQAGDAKTAVTAMQQLLTDQYPGLQARLLVRRGEAQETWMEAYARPADEAGIDADLEADIERHAAALAAVIDGNRHAEAFDVVG